MAAAVAGKETPDDAAKNEGNRKCPASQRQTGFPREKSDKSVENCGRGEQATRVAR